MKIAGILQPIVRWCAGCLRDILLFCIWGALVASVIFQIFVWSSREIPMPGWLLRKLEVRLADAGLTASIGSATVSSDGHVEFERFRLMQQGTESPLLSAESIHLTLDPWALLGGVLSSRTLHADGVALWLPAMHSPSGQTEPIASNINLVASADRKELHVQRMDGQLGRVTFSLAGTAEIPPGMLRRKPVDRSAAARKLIKDYLRIARRMSDVETALGSLEQPHLSVTLQPAGESVAHAHVTGTARGADINLSSRLPRIGRLQASWLRVSTRLMLHAPRGQTARIEWALAHAQSSTGAQVLNARGSLIATASPDFAEFDPRSLALTCGSIMRNTLSAENVSGTFSLVPLQQLSGNVSAQAAGCGWSIDGEVNPRTGAGILHVKAAVTPWMLEQLSRRVGRPMSELVTAREPAPVQARIVLGEGWEPQAVEGHVTTGPLLAHGVTFDSVSANFDLRGRRLLTYDMRGYQGENFARGSYEMDTRSFEYRFLLDGRLRPMGIAGFFQDWWPNFWKNFDFKGGIPDASVEVAGRWGKPGLTTVFVRADVANPVVRDVPLDRVRTTIFIRPEYYNGLELVVNRGAGMAAGTFTRSVDLTRHEDALRTMSFDITSTLDLHESARLFGKEGTEIVAPFKFEQPPRLHLHGVIDGGASHTGPRRLVHMELKSADGFALHGFPLRALSFKGVIRDTEVNLDQIRAAFAGGEVRGTVFLHGPEKERQLRFDMALHGAGLGEAIRTLEEFFSQGKGPGAAQPNRFQRRLAEGKLNLQLAAGGLYQDPLSFSGTGSLDLSGAQLAQINLLGALSEVLSKSSLFSFTALQLNGARSSLRLDRSNLSFPDLRITGPTAAIEARGSVELGRKEMDFNAKVYPFSQGKTLLADAVGFVLIPLSNALELKLGGTIDKPDWRFAYGPTSMLHGLSGTKPGQFREPPVPAGERKIPAPYLRR